MLRHSLCREDRYTLGHQSYTTLNRDNILDRKYRKIGVGVAVAEEVEYEYISETVYATQNFSACR